jgi:hypothetical protein
MKRKKIELTSVERKELEDFSRKGIRSVKLVKRAEVILEPDRSLGRKAVTQQAIADKVGLSRNAVSEIKRDFPNAENVTKFLRRKQSETRLEKKITGEVEAHIIALACGPVPSGYARWTLSLLAEKSVELQYVESISAMSISRLLKKRNLSRT